MKKLGDPGKPIIIRVQNQERAGELAQICEDNNWKFICGIEPDEPEDISDLEYMLNPKTFGYKEPKKKNFRTPIKKEVQIGRNDNCPCGSGLKYKKCCMNN
ncbi:MAG: SEC-C metal-binding domain-containing protein [Dysgonamonadaceae bacterium]|nr:SEC-C metal-binding domain-containing protein [Dysgonamonadaceae bacterium]